LAGSGTGNAARLALGSAEPAPPVSILDTAISETVERRAARPAPERKVCGRCGLMFCKGHAEKGKKK
jgi:hypothetical protein